MFKLLKKQIVPILILLGLIFALYLISYLIPEPKIQKFITDAGIFGPVFYTLLTLIAYILAPISNTPLIFAGFYLFGQQVVIFNIIATIIASIINFWIARKWGRKYIIKLVGKSTIEHLDKLAGEYGLQTLFVLRVFQGGIHDLISYAAGLTSIQFWPYFIISAIGMIPGNILWYVFATKTQNPLIFTLFTFGLATTFSSLYILALYLHRKFK